MTVGSLFSGIGGLDLGLERAGMTVKWQVELDPYCNRVLAKHWPGVTRYGDIKLIDWNEVEPVDLICGGFPCQPVSLAGKRLAQDDPRWLWPEVARCLRSLRPRYLLLENVPGLLSAGMGDVLGDLAARGYDAEWDCIPAAAVGAPHRRYRVWIVAYPRSEFVRDESRRGGGASREGSTVSGDDGSQASMAYAGSAGRYGTCGCDAGHADANASHGHVLGDSGTHVAHAQVLTKRPGLCPDGTGWERGRRLGDGSCAGDVPDADGQHVGRLDDGGAAVIGATTSRDESGRHAVRFGDWWTVEPDVGRVAHGVLARVDRLRGLGNAVVPQVAEWVGRRIMECAA